MVWFDKLDIEGMVPIVLSFLPLHHCADIFVFYQLRDKLLNAYSTQALTPDITGVIKISLSYQLSGCAGQ